MTFTTRRPDEETPLLRAHRQNTSSEKKRRSPIPWGQFSILLILQLAEPLVSQVILPFAPQLIRDIGVTHGDERRVGYFVGMMQSLFFAAQALTVLHWSTISDHYGRKPVILTGLFGIALSMYSFGLSTSFTGLIVARALNGALNGNIGVIKSQFASLFDDTNMADAYAWLPLAWSTGATLGPMIGGSLSRPVDRFPDLFGASTFLRTYPYFLPCAVSGTFAAFAWIITFFFLDETVASPKSLARLFRLRNSRQSLVFQNIVEGEDPSVSCDAQPENPSADKKEERPYPLRALLTRNVLVSGGNYALFSLIDIGWRGIQPLFYSTPMELGGLGMSPPQIGLILSGLGIASGLFQILFFARINDRFGSKNTFILGIISVGVVFATFPVVSVLASQRGFNWLVWAVMGVQLCACMLTGLSYGCIFIFITAASPNRASLGSTNGLCQMVVSWMRAAGPAIFNSLYSMSLQEGDWMIYWVLEVAALIAFMAACLLPHTPWKR